jgi:hypothetical protein
MRFIEISGFSIKPDRNRAFQEWFIAHQQALADSYPEGTSLVGIFATIYSSEKQAGDLMVLEQLDSYAAQDRIAAAGRDPDSAYSRLVGEMYAFIDPNPAAGYSKILLKDVVDTTVFNYGPRQPDTIETTAE